MLLRMSFAYCGFAVKFVVDKTVLLWTEVMSLLGMADEVF